MFVLTNNGDIKTQMHLEKGLWLVLHYLIDS